MRTRRLVARVGFLLCCPIVLNADALRDKLASPPTNVYGAPTMRADGERITYTQSELAGHSVASPRVARASSPITGVPAVWSYTVFGTGIGAANILIGRAGGKREIYAGGSRNTFGLDEYWYALQRAASSGEYEQVFVSEVFESPIVRMGLADLVYGQNNEIVLALESGEIVLYDEETRFKLPGFSTVQSPTGMVLRDLDGDGKAELILTTAGGLWVYSGGGAFLWDVPGVGGDVCVGQMDDDPDLEIATTSGDVVDTATHTVQWHWPDGFGYGIRAGDVDEDGRDEVVANAGWTYVWAYDVERQLPKWSLPASDHDIAVLELVDVDCDGRLDLLVGEGQWGSVKAFDTVSMGLKWSIGNPYHGITSVAVGDANGDGQDEVLWGSGWTDTGPDHLYVADLATQQVLWSSLDLVGPFLGPAAGDLDGDGQPEIVSVASLSDSGYGGSRILVFDAKTGALRAVSPTIGSGFFPALDLKLRNVDADAALEIVVGANYLYNGVVRIFDFDGATNTFNESWTSPETNSSPVDSVETADLDGDGGLEVIAGGSGGASLVSIYDYATRTLEWNTFVLGGAVRDVAVESAGGGHPDLLAIVEGGELFAFDAVTHEALQITPGQFTVMRPSPDPSARSVFLGDANGNVYRYDRGPMKYELAATYPLGLTWIDGVTPFPGGSALVGSGGQLFYYPSLSGAPTWSSADFGAPVGRYACLGQGAHARYLTSSALAILEVAPGAAVGSLSEASGPASGGTTVTFSGINVQIGAGLFFGDDPASGVGVVPPQIHGDTPPMTPGSLRPVLVVNPDSSFETSQSPFFVDFLDVDAGNLFHDSIETIFRRGVTGGCGSGLYCGQQFLTRAQMAVFLVRAGFGATFVPPKAQGRRFTDVACGSFAADEIEWIALQGITVGCGGGAFCGDSPVTRAQMAVFLLKTLEGSSYVPPPAQGIFDDVPADDPFAPWIEELAARGITAGCDTSHYCPSEPATREQMAALISLTFFVT